MIQRLLDSAKTIIKYFLFIWTILIIIWFFGEYLKFLVYHLNLSLYIMFGSYLHNSTIITLLTGILTTLLITIVYFIKKIL